MEGDFKVKVLVTGISGLDGQTMVDYLLTNTDCEIIGICRDLRTTLKYEANPRIYPYLADITESYLIENIVSREKPDYFINFAGLSSPNDSWSRPIEHFNSNSLAVVYQLEAIKNHVPKCKYFNAGSCLERGDIKTPYAASKLSSRAFVELYRRELGLFATQAWLYPHEGPNRPESFVSRKITSNVARIKKSLELGQPFAPLELGNLDIKRTFGSAEDIVDGVWKILNADQPEDFVLGFDEIYSIREFVDIVFGVSDISTIWAKDGVSGEEKLLLADERGWPTKKTVVLAETKPELKRKEESPLQFDSNKAKIKLNWWPKVGLEELIKKMLDHDIQELEKTS